MSKDNGGSWRPINTGLTNLLIRSIVASGDTVFAGTAAGVFISTDDGDSWTELNSGLTNLNVRTLALSSGHLFAGTQDGVYLYDMEAGLWYIANDGLTMPTIYSLVISGDDIFVGTTGGIFVSSIDGIFWTDVTNGLNANYRRFAATESAIFVGHSGWGVAWSTDRGSTWSDANYGLTNTFVRVLAISGNNVFAGTAEGGVFINSSLLSSAADDIESDKYDQISIYPNPANNSIKFEVNDVYGDAHLSIFNTSGQKVLDLMITDLQTTVDISAFPPGVYFLRYGNNTILKVGKLIID